MKRLGPKHLVFVAVAAVTLIVAACGGADPTATPQPTATPAPTATPVPPTPTPTPEAMMMGKFDMTSLPTAGKLGGTLHAPALSSEPYGYDSFENGGPALASEEIWQPVHNNLVVPDNYAEGSPLYGDIAESWEYSDAGQTLTFSIRKGIRFHDGDPLTAEDVAYNIDRAWKPRSDAMRFFKNAFVVIDSVTQVDDYTVRVGLKEASNSLLGVMGRNVFLMYPAHIPFPEQLEVFEKNPVGTGPFKLEDMRPQEGMSLVRNDDYFVEGLPYLDAVEYTFARGDTVIAAFRTARLHVTSFNSNELDPDIVRRLTESTGWIPVTVGQGPALYVLNQRAPWTDKRARRAFHLAVDRQALIDIWRGGAGSPYSAPLLAPELGGRWGIPEAFLKGQPGWGSDKPAEIEQAKALLKEAGVDPSQFTMTILSSVSWPEWGSITENTVRGLGFKTDLLTGTGRENTERVLRGDFDIYQITASISFDDPANYLSNWVLSDGSSNYGNWSIPRLDELLTAQDKELDSAKRAEMLFEVQRIILEEHYGAYIPAINRVSFIGHQPFVKNYYTNVGFNHHNIFRHEQLWLDQ